MLSQSEKVEFLKKTELFKGLSEDTLKVIANIAKEVHFSDGKTIFKEGDKGDAVYFIIEGRVRVHKSGVEIATRNAGECVGEMAVMDEGSRSASVSSAGNSKLLKLEMEKGDFYKAIQDDLELLRSVLQVIVRRFREDMERQIQVIRQNERMIQDITRARELQMNMLPSQDLCIHTSNGIELTASGICYPAELVGGDYYDYFPLPDNKVGLVIGDVMGHGFPAGLMVSTAKSCLYTQTKADSSVLGVMSAMNDIVYGFVHGNLFMSFCYIIIDLIDKTFSFCNAGHCYPYHYKAKTKCLEALESNACLLGVLEYQYFQKIDRVWEPGDLIVMYTDGITEAQNMNNKYFGENRLKRLIKANSKLSPSQLSEKIFQELSSFCQGKEWLDDASLVVIRMSD